MVIARLQKCNISNNKKEKQANVKKIKYKIKKTVTFLKARILLTVNSCVRPFSVNQHSTFLWIIYCFQ